MRTLTRRTAATIVAIALILWGADGLDAPGARAVLAYAALAVALVLAYYALTGRMLLPGRDDGE
jgi:hypothetical protein